MEARTDQCSFGLRARGPDGVEGPVLKPTRFITNSVAVQQELSVTCRGCKSHVQLQGSLTSKAAIYPKPPCRAVCRGVVQQMRHDAAGVMSLSCVEVAGAGVDDAGVDSVSHEEYDWSQYYDDMSGKRLPAALVEAARAEEMAEVKRMQVWEKVPR